MSATDISAEELTNNGERMIVDNHWGYWAHLSIYRFALPFAKGKRVLDAGCGSGYGSVYLARQGAKVLAVDAGEVAVKHCQVEYANDPIAFEVADLGKPLTFEDGSFDLVFSSNVFEHVGEIDTLCAECARVMTPDGLTIVAVPPICSAKVAKSDMDNQFHVHHIPPTAWHAKLSRFFTEVECYEHHTDGKFADKELLKRELHLPREQVTVRETDFDFPKTTAEKMMSGETITAIFVCRGRILEPGPETLAERTPASWKEGELAAQVIYDLKAHEAELVRDNWILNEQKMHELLARGTAEQALVKAETQAQADSEASARKVSDLEIRLARVEAEKAAIQARLDSAEAAVAAQAAAANTKAKSPLLAALGLARR
ncbi:class I SAM-dependent methyltransferase [Methylobacterium fujisawaense]|uniref:class I SAM-dependent methyltransferase n=1 Tax=Methylobacterium fujisawaense TaxID=107400 RepID=UPI0031F56E73